MPLAPAAHARQMHAQVEGDVEFRDVELLGVGVHGCHGTCHIGWVLSDLHMPGLKGVMTIHWCWEVYFVFGPILVSVP